MKMKMKTRKHNNLTSILARNVLAAFFLSQACLMSTSNADDGDNRESKAEAPTPDGYTKYLVFMANGTMPASGFPFQVGEDALENFHRSIMGRSDAEIQQNAVDAGNFFLERFGLDVWTVDPLDPAAPFVFFPIFFDPQINYRAYTISGESVPSEGWVVRDGGWALVTQSELTLGGEFAGEVVPTGTLMLFGDYNIKRTKPGKWNQPKPIIIHYQAGSPAYPPASASDQLSFNCELSSEEFGEGRAQGIEAPVVINGELVENIRNILTFSDLGGL